VKQIMNKSVAEPVVYVCNVNNALAQFSPELIGLGRIAVTVSAYPHKAACSAFRELDLFHHPNDSLALGLWG
jgi:hypothetical protein